MKTKFEKPGTFPQAGPIGRTVHIVNGIVILYFFILVLQHYAGFIGLREGWDVPKGVWWWIGAGYCFLLLPVMVNRGFTLEWGKRPQLVFVLLALAAAGFDFWYYGSLWGPPLSLLVVLLMAYVFAHLGFSYIVAAVAASPG